MMHARMIRHSLFLSFTAASAALVLSGCGLIKSVPIPFMGHGDSPATAADPQVAFSASGKLQPGHTLDISVYEGLRSPGRLYHGRPVVDANGLLDLGKVGKSKVGGLTALEAERKIEAAFRTQAGGAVVQVHISSIEDVPTVTVTGAVRQPAVIQWFDGATVDSVLPYVGGHDPRSGGRAVYVTHKGVRKFYANAHSGDAITLHAGDIVSFSSDL